MAGTKRKGKTTTVVVEEESSDDWCFVCKDAGDPMRICDRKKCGKPYHPRCVDKNDSFLNEKGHWVCDWHTCFHCGRSSYCHCYTCKNSVCNRCLLAEDFVQVKGKYGFCDECLEYAVLIEKKEDLYNSDGEKVDFTDRDTFEGLFKEYYDIIKKEKGIEARDVFAAKESLETKNERQTGSGSEEYDDEQISDYESSEHVKKNKRTRKEKRSEKGKFAPKAPMKSRKDVFIGWASRSLIEFLTSIGKSTNEKLSQDDVTSIINVYIKDNKLLVKKKMIMCDGHLRSLFHRSAINRHRIYELLEDHFAENHNESEDELDNDSEDELDDDSEDENAGVPCKKQMKLDSENKSPKMEPKRLSCFASITVENMKLVYLKKNLLRELLEQPSYEKKVIGSFVLIKCGPHDYRSKKLVQVEGVKKTSSGENNMQVVLQVSAIPEDVSIDLLLNADITEEECEDLRQRMASGQLKRPTVEDLQKKAEILHKDLTNQRIKRDLQIFGKKIEQAHAHGWRREFFEYKEKKKTLESPSEQARLLGDAPQVIPDVHEQLDSNSGDITNDMNSDKGSPQSILQCSSSVPKNGWQNDKEYGHKFADLESEKWCILGPKNEREKCSLSALKMWSDTSPCASKFKVWREDEKEEKAIWVQEALSYAFPKK